jgi:hypothetical protein
MPDRLPFLSDELHFAITKMALRVGQMDWHVESLISSALSNQPTTAAFTLKTLSADGLIGAARAILLDGWPADETRINELFDEVEAVRGERTDLLHWMWGSTAEPDAAIHASPRSIRQEEKKTAAEIVTIAGRAMKTIEKMLWWQNEIYARLHPELRQALWPLGPPANSSEPSNENH